MIFQPCPECGVERTHPAICQECGRIERQVRELEAAARAYGKRDPSPDIYGDVCQRNTALVAKVAELEKERDAFRSSLMHACELRQASHENERQLWAMRQTANWLGAPFSHERVQEKYEEWASVEYELSSAIAARQAAEREVESMRSIGQRVYDTICALTLLPNLDRSLWASLCNVHSQMAVLLGRANPDISTAKGGDHE